MSGRWPSATITLTSPDGMLRAHGVGLDDWETARDQLVSQAAAAGYVGPYVVAPAPGRPEGVTIDGLTLAPTTWGELSPRWQGRRVLVRWEDLGDGDAAPLTVREYRGTVEHVVSCWALVIAGIRHCRIPDHAHVIELQA